MTQALAADPRFQTLDLPDPGRLADADDRRATEVLDRLERLTMETIQDLGNNPQLLLDAAGWPAMSVWMGMRKRAIALHPLHTFRAGDRAALGNGIVPGDLRRPLVDGADAFAVLAATMGAEVAADTARQYDTFLTTPWDPSLEILFGAHTDARAIRWRALAAQRAVLECAAGWTGTPLLVSLGCGAAGATAELARDLAAHGSAPAELLLVDHDPVALSAGRTIAERYVDPASITVQLRGLIDIRARRATAQIPHVAAGSAHLVDLLGLFEYLPDMMAVDLLAQTRPILRDGGALLVGNMLRQRRGQTSFDHVIQWPRLKQRTVEEVLCLAERAGFDTARTTVVQPPWTDAVYAVYVFRA